MNRKLFVISCVAMLCCSMAMNGQYRSSGGGLSGDNYHFGYVSGTVGFSMLQMSNPGAVSSGKCGGAIGVGYEFRNSGFWTSVGVQMSFHRSSLVMDEYTRDFNGFDTQGKATIFHYRVNQTDEQEWNFIDVPILFGYYIQGFYIGLGPKLSYALNPTTHSYGSYNLSATNVEYNVTFQNMPEHGYTDYSFDARTANRMNVGVSLIGEIGYDVLSMLGSRSRWCNVLKVGFYFEYGLNNFAGKWETEQQNITPNPNNATQATVSPYINALNGRRMVPFYAGLKVTYMIGGSRTARVGFHRGCMCYN